MRKFFVVFCLVIVFSYPVAAQQLIWRPIHDNPYLLSQYYNSAQIQDPHGFLKAEAKAAVKQDLLEKFKDRLTERALNELSRKMIDIMFGDESIPEDPFYIGDYKIEIETTVDGGVRTTITDTVSNNTTTVEVPYPYY